MASSDDVLLLVAVRTDQHNIKRRMEMILAGADPSQPGSNAEVFAKPVDELVAQDLDRLAAIIGWPAVRRLNVGDVVSPPVVREDH